MSSPAHAGRQPWRLGIVGCGKVVERLHLPALKASPNWRLVAAFDPLAARQEWMRQAWPEVAVYESLEELCARSDVDACLVATPPATHYRTAMRVLEAGRHVLVEKPMALRVSEAQHLHDSARRLEKQLWVGFNRRFSQPYMRLREQLQFVPREELQQIRFTLAFDVRNWNAITAHLGDDSKGSGILDDVVSHQSDLLAWLLDEPVREVIAARPATNGHGSTSIRYTLVFGDGAAAECVAGHGDRYVEHLEIQLRDRRLVAYPSGLFATRRLPTRVIQPICHWMFVLNLLMHKLTRTPTGTIRSFERQWSAFAQALHTHGATSLGPNAASGLHSVQVVQACREALRSGGRHQLRGEET